MEGMEHSEVHYFQRYVLPFFPPSGHKRINEGKTVLIILSLWIATIIMVSLQ